MAEARPADEEAVLRAWGEVIRRYRQWKRLSRRELAHRAGLSSVFLGEIERGEKDPSSHSLSLIARGLGAPLAELYMRVAARLDGSESTGPPAHQPAFPLGIRESGEEYLDGVPQASDETAFDLYKLARQLPTEQQVSLLILAQSLRRSRE